jgi:ATP-binding cassette subfamily F protein uup
VVGQVKLEIDKGAPSGKLVAVLDKVYKSYPDPAASSSGAQKDIVVDFSATLLRGDKIGIIGPNGAGKTTLLKLILGELQPDSGDIKLGTKLSVAYFDQHREKLDLNASLVDFISPGSEWIEIGTQKKHVKSYLTDFLFSPARANSPVKSLSGGERNRLLLARLFARPANVLVLDEPTNDLDIDTLELLEELIQNYDGTVFIVSHDRAFIDQVVTSTLVYENSGRWREYEGGVQDWLIQAQRSKEMASLAQPSKTEHKDSLKKSEGAALSATPLASKVKPQAALKLSFKEQKELDGLPGLMAEKEIRQQAIHQLLSDANLFQHEPFKANDLAQELNQLDTSIADMLARWEELTLKQEGLA